MEVSLLKVSSNLSEKAVLSNSNHSPITRPGELVLAKQESDKCKHFTIRGFVSEARKRNAKNCWPFPMLNHALDDNVDILPPLPVKKFRHWDCQSCLNGNIAPETFKENGANMTNQNDGVKNKRTLLIGDATEASHRGTTKLLVRLPRQSKENNLEGITVREDNSDHVSSDGHGPLLCCGKKQDASPTSDLITGGIRVSKGGYNRSKENQNLRSKTTGITSEEEACQTGEKGEGNIIVRENISGISFISEDSPKSLSSKQNRTALVHRTGGRRNSDQICRSLSFTVAASDRERDQSLRKIGKRKELNTCVPEHRMPLGVDVAIQEDGAFLAQLTHIHHHESKDLDESRDEASDTSIPLIRSLLPSRDDVRKQGITVEKSRPKKSLKMRTLDDIMKSVEIQNDEKYCSSGENAGISGSGTNETHDASKQKDEQPKHKCHLIQITEPTLIKRKNRMEALANDGEGSCLIHWLKKVPRKAGLHKGEGEARHINTAPCTPKCTTVKGLDLNLEYSGRGENKKETIGEKKRNMMPEVEVVKSSFMPKEDRRAQKGHIITKDLQTNNLNAKSSGIILSEKELHHKIETHDNIRKEAPLSNKNNKRPLVEEGTCGISSQQRSKDCFGFQKEAAFQVHIEVKKKQKTMRISEQEAGDDIPMDIVELLAKKQQERHVTNTKHDSANMGKISESTRNMNDGNGRANTAGAHGNRVSDAVNRCLYQQESQCNLTGYDAGTTVITNGDVECRSKFYHYCSGGKQYHHFDLNQEAPVCSSAELQAPSPYIGLSLNGAQLSIADADRNYSQQVLSTNGTKMQDFCSNHMGQRVPPQNLFSNAHVGSCGLVNGYPPQINAHKVCSDFNPNGICLGENLKTVAYNTAYRMMVNPGADKAESSPTAGILAAKSFAESRNGYYSNMMWPVDLLDNDSVSALNLLRLMHHSAWSGEPFHSSIHNDNMGYFQASNGHGSELLGSEVDVKDPRRASGASGNWEFDNREENLCKPLRPLPRFGILGPLLQNEITNTSRNSTSTLGFGARNLGESTFHKSSFIARQSNELISHKTIEKGKAEASPLNPVTKAMNLKTSISRYGVSGRIDSSLANPGCTLANDNISQVLTGSRDGAFHPIRSTCKMEECVVNRNPADFAMPDSDSEYMIGYQETKTKDMPRSGSILSRSHLHNQKGQKMRKLDDLNRYRTSNKSSLSRFSCPQKAM